MLDTPDINKEKYMGEKNSIKVKQIAKKYASKLSGVCKKYLRQKIGENSRYILKQKCMEYHGQINVR